MRPRSAASFFLALALVGLVGMIGIGLSMVWQVEGVEQAAEASHLRDAHTELARSVDDVMQSLGRITEFLANWDEARQQLNDPTYYLYWRVQRVAAVKAIPDYVTAIELYTSEGNALRPPRDDLMPAAMPGEGTRLRVDDGRGSLLSFMPIRTEQTGGTVLGFVGVRLDLNNALREVGHFLHVDRDSLRLKVTESASTDAVDLTSLFEYQEFHDNDLELLKGVIYGTYGLSVALILALLLLLLWIVYAFLTQPLGWINDYLGNLRQSFAKTPAAHPGDRDRPLAVRELHNLFRELCDYHDNWVETKTQLDRLNTELEARVRERTLELQSVNTELEAFAYSVSHDLRGPLRAIDGYSDILLEDFSRELDGQCIEHLQRIRANARHMAQLIDDLLTLSRITRRELVIGTVDLSALASECVDRLREQDPGRAVTVEIEPGMSGVGDPTLLTVLLDNLIGNAWKYSSRATAARIEFGMQAQDGRPVFFVRDNGAGFDMQFRDKLFIPFNRLHGNEYEGTGIGLATVARIVKRHHGEIWAEAEPGRGATFFFSLGPVGDGGPPAVGA